MQRPHSTQEKVWSGNDLCQVFACGQSEVFVANQRWDLCEVCRVRRRSMRAQDQMQVLRMRHEREEYQQGRGVRPSDQRESP